MKINIFYSIRRGKFVGEVDGKVVSCSKRSERVEKAVDKFVKFGFIKKPRKQKVKSSIVVDQSIRNKLIEFTKEAVNVANEKFPDAKVTMPRIEFFQRTGRAGTVWHLQNLIMYNEVLAQDNLSEFPNVAKHEVAHIVTHRIYPNAKQAHGPEFKHVLTKMGGDGRTYHSMDVSKVKTRKKKFRAVYSCDCKTLHNVTRNAHKKISLFITGYRCKKCGSSLFFTGQTKVI